jgi:hypothetical protein
MDVDERIRGALREATSDHPLDLEHALRAVRARVPTVVETVERRRQSARLPRVVAVLAVCALIAGAVALPFSLRSTSDHAAAPGRCGHAVKSGYQSAALVRFPRVSATGVPPVVFREPVQAALALCDGVLAGTHPHTDDVQFNADARDGGNLVSLVVTTPSRVDAAALARAWGLAFVDARRADAMHQILDQQRALTEHVAKLHEELRRVDIQLVKLAPLTYRNVLRFDGGYHQFQSIAPNNSALVDPVPQPGRLGILAYKRISLLSALTESGRSASVLRIMRVKPDGYATVVSVSAPVRFPASSGDGELSAIWLVVGLLAGGALLAGGGVLLGRRTRRARSQ